MRTILAALFATLFALSSPAMGKTVGIDLSRYPVGTRFISVDGNNQTWALVLTSVEGDFYELSNYWVGDEDSVLWNTQIALRDGNVVKFYGPGDEVWTYAPHDCRNTLGDCRYTADNGESRPLRFRRTVSMKNSKVTWKRYAPNSDNQEELRAQGSYLIGDHGFPAEGEAIFWGGSQSGWEKSSWKLIEIISP